MHGHLYGELWWSVLGENMESSRVEKKSKTPLCALQKEFSHSRPLFHYFKQDTEAPFSLRFLDWLAIGQGRWRSTLASTRGLVNHTVTKARIRWVPGSSQFSYELKTLVCDETRLSFRPSVIPHRAGVVAQLLLLAWSWLLGLTLITSSIGLNIILLTTFEK